MMNLAKLANYGKSKGTLNINEVDSGVKLLMFLENPTSIEKLAVIDEEFFTAVLFIKGGEGLDLLNDHCPVICNTPMEFLESYYQKCLEFDVNPVDVIKRVKFIPKNVSAKLLAKYPECGKYAEIYGSTMGNMSLF